MTACPYCKHPQHRGCEPAAISVERADELWRTRGPQWSLSPTAAECEAIHNVWRTLDGNTSYSDAFARIIQTYGAFTDGQPVEVNVELGPLGKRWSTGYTFHKYEPHGEHPLAAFTRVAPMCFVRVVGGFSDGCIVRYRVDEVRAAVTP